MQQTQYPFERKEKIKLMLNPKKSELDEILGFKTEVKVPSTLSGLKDREDQMKKWYLNPSMKVRNKSDLRRNRVSSKAKLEEQR